MSKLSASLSLLCALGVPPLAAATVDPVATCEVRQTDRVRSVTFASGRTLSIAGHEHGLTADVMNIGRLADDTESTNDVYLVKAALRLRALESTLTQFRADVAHLRSLVAGGRLDFIALEYGDEVMRMMTSYASRFMPLVRENLAQRKLPSSQLVDDSFLVFAGPTLYLLETEPELMKNVTLVAAEDDELMEKSLDAVSTATAHLDEVVTRHALDESIRTALTALLVRSMLEYDLHAHADDAWVLDELRTTVPTASFADARASIELGLAAGDLLRQRDARSAPKILSQEGSGVLLIGSAHGRSLAESFRRACATK